MFYTQGSDTSNQTNLSETLISLETKKSQKLADFKAVKCHGIYFTSNYYLNKYIYPLIKDSCLIHASFHKYEINAKPFPISYNDKFNFVGEYVYADESRSESHINALKNSL